jgi:type II secretory pathway component GspD/PulD (secretin)
MKANLCVLTIACVLAFRLTGSAQNNTPGADTPAAAATTATHATDASASGAPVVAQATPPAEGAAPSTTDTNAATTGTNATVVPAATATTDTNAPATTNAEQTATAAPVMATEVNTNANTNDVVIPLIVMDDVPLTDAIKNLARQAGLNYMLDPKITYGQIGPDGRPVAQPSISIRWENVTAAQALAALLNNYNMQLVEDPKSHIAKISPRDPAAPDPLMTRIFQLKYASPQAILTNIAVTLTDKRSRAVADVRTSQLVVLATEKELVTVETLIDHLDSATRQVLIEARLIETSMNPATIKGINWSGTLQNQTLAFGNNLQQNSPALSVNNTLSQTFPRLLVDTAKGFNPATAFLDADGVSAVLSFLNTYSDAKVLSTPRTVTLDNEPATLSVTRATPIINVTAGTANTTGGSQINYTNLGVILNVTPRISANNFVNLKVTPEVSRIFDTVSKSIAGQVFQADEYDIRRMQTSVMIPSGNTLVLGGLVQDDVRNSNTKVPVLGDIPIVGLAFRADSKSRQKNNLVIFITPTIVQDADYQPTKTDFLKSPVPMKDSVEGDWSAWDSGKPKDWSKPEPRADAQ